MNAQEIVAANVAARGYKNGWTDEQFAARQLAKAVEELAEAANHVIGPAHFHATHYWLNDLKDAGIAARIQFDQPLHWRDIGIDDIAKLRRELADVQVVLLAAAQALDFDIIQAAIHKSGADVERGVRGTA